MIRPATINDLEIIAEINTNAWKVNYKGIIDDEILKTRTVEQFIKAATEANWIENNKIDIFVYEENNLVKGFVSGEKYCGKDCCEMSSLYVEPEEQKQGIGAQLFEYMKAKYKSAGCKNIIIWTVKGLANNAFYKKRGGEIRHEKEYNFGGKKYQGIGLVFEL